jgi:hypothetical protein
VFELADLFAQQARRRTGDLFRAVWHNDDDANYKLAKNVLEGRYGFIEEGIIDPAGGDDQPLVAGQPSGDEAATNGSTPEVAAPVK